VQANDGAAPVITLSESVFSGGFDVSLALFDSATTMDRCLVEGVQPLAADGTFGDGIGVFAGGPLGDATLQLSRSRVDHASRAGLGAFGTTIELSDSVLSCSQIDINGEDVNGGVFQVVDQGGNQCGCAELADCKIVSSNLNAPSPIPVQE
jgi:hypothetical protein